MAFNPFLSMGEPMAPVSAELNPFMMDAAEAEAGNFPADNPFAAGNPFSDFGGFDSAPLTPPATAALPDVFERPAKPTELPLPPRPPPPRPLPPDTQTLIQSVTGHLELTSSHMLGRIPPTRSPSPVSARDLHSPSPTAELLPADPPAPAASAELDVNRNKPARPPPPPRPAPPPRPGDDINLFAAPAPPTGKPSTAHILSLYATPVREPEPPDFLSADLPPAAALCPQSEHEPEPEPASAADVFAAAETPEAIPARPTPAPAPASAPSAAMDWSTEPPQRSTPHSTVTSPFDMSTAGQTAATSNPFADFGAESAASNTMNASPFGEDATDAFASDSPNAFAVTPAKAFEKTTTNVFESTAASVFDSSAASVFDSSMDVHESASSNDIFELAPTNVLETTPSEMLDSTPTNVLESTPANAFGSTHSNIFDAPATDTFNSANAFAADTAGAFGANINNAFGASGGDVFGGSSAAFSSPRDGFEAMQTEQSEAPPAPALAAGWGAPHDDAFPESQDAFDAFSAKFDSTTANHVASSAWGADGGGGAADGGFEAEGEGFDDFLSLSAPPATPRLPHQGSNDSDSDNFSLFIRPKATGEASALPAPLAPPPRPHALPESPRANPFDKSADLPPFDSPAAGPEQGEARSGGETPPTPLFDEDTSQPLEDFPRTKYDGPGWEMHLRQPNKKKITGQRFWKKIFVRITLQGDNPVVQLFTTVSDKEPFQELPLQACYSVSEVGAQQFDQFGKIFTVKLQYVFYKERPGVRPGQVTKAERITNKLSQFAAYAIQGDYQGVKEFGSDLRKLGLPVEHAPQLSQLFKIGSLVYEDVLQFSCCIEEALFRLPAHRDRALTYKMEEVQVTAVDELYVEQDAEGSVIKQIARVRLFFLGFLSGMPDVELGVNDLRRQGKEVVGRHDIIPVVTEEWIRVEDTEFHACVQPEEFANTQIIKFKPPDACYIELMRFRVRPPKNRELPLQLKAMWLVLGSKVELRADVLVPGFASRSLGQVPCEDVAIRFPLPECWIYLFRVEKHFRYGSVKSAHRRTGKIKGIERFLGAVDTLQESLIEVTSGQAKYEHQHRAIVWRMPRLPKEGQGAYTTHNLVCRMALTSYEQVPESLATHAHVSFTMPATQASHTTVRSVSLQNHDGEPPEKYVRYLARHEYIVGIERTSRQDAPAYAVAAKVEPPPAAPAAAPAAPALPQPPSSDSDSD